MPRQRSQHLLISTKLNRPLVDEKWVKRPRLIPRLDEGRKKRVTLISAPAGYGKTTVVVQWLDQSKRLSAWLSLDKNDSDPERFLQYVIAALRTVVPKFGPVIEPLLSSVQLPPPDYLADAMVSELAALKNPTVLVLDDYQTLSSDGVQKILTRMVERLPDNLHLVILTRVDPPWPLARWRAQQWLNELRAADLSFTQEEMRKFFQEYALTAETIGILQKRIEGWIVGLQLLKLSLADVQDPEQFARSFSNSDRLIVDYLMDEVISRQPGEVLEFLAVTAQFDRFCAPLCDHVLADVPGRQESRLLLGRLERENLFLVPLDRERRWCRYHNLFRELLLRHTALRLPDDRRSRLNRLAGEWFAGQGMIEEAIRHYIAGGDVDSAALLIEGTLHTIIDEDLSRRRLRRLLDMFPRDAEGTRPFLMIAQAYAKLFRWDFPAAAQLLDRVESLLKDLGKDLSEVRRCSIQADIEAQRGFCMFWAGDIAGALSHSLRALQIVPKDHRYTYSLATSYAAGSHALSGRKDEALSLLAEIAAQHIAADNPYLGPIYLAQMAIHSYAGDLNAVLDSARQMLVMHDRVMIPDYWLGYAYYFQGWVAYERNEMDTAIERFEMVREIRYQVVSTVYHDCRIGLALVAMAGKDFRKARGHIDTAIAAAMEMGNPYAVQMSQMLMSRQAYLSGEAPRAIPSLSSVTAESVRFWLLVPSLVEAENLILQGTPAGLRSALQSIEDGLKRAQKHHNTRQVIQFLAVKATALKCAGRETAALRVLEKTLKMAKPLGFIRTFLDRGPLMADLLKSLLKKSPRDGYLRDLLAAFASEKSPAGLTAVPHEKPAGVMPEGAAFSAAPLSGLTNREMDVLILLEQRLSNKEIADRLHVSTETVKTHAINIFRKMEVSGRRQAVVAAKKAGLLPAK